MRLRSLLDAAEPVSATGGKQKSPAPDQAPPDWKAEVARLAALSPVESDREIAAAARKLGCHVPTLNAEVKAARRYNAMAPSPGQGRAIIYPKLEPWPKPVEGAALLDELVTILNRYVILSNMQVAAVALWAAYTHGFDNFDTSPKLIVGSPESGCGKTRLIEVMERLVPRPQLASGTSPAALWHVIEADHPTLLLDEMDTIMKGDREKAETLRGILNSGFTRRGANFLKCVPTSEGGWVVHKFSTWSPQMAAGIGSLPDTVRNRGINIAMKKKLKDEKVAALTEQGGGDLCEIGRKLARWIGDNEGALRAAVPTPPDGLSDRACDAWAPLLAIAGLAGGEWPQRARDAALELSRDGVSDDGNIERMLLTDIREIFTESIERQIASADLVSALTQEGDRPWADWRDGRPITQNALARLLKRYGIRPGTIRNGREPKDTAKGYKLEDFTDAFGRYLHPPPDSNRHTVTTAAAQGFPAHSEPSQPDPMLRFEKHMKANNDGHCDGMTVENPHTVHVRI